MFSSDVSSSDWSFANKENRSRCHGPKFSLLNEVIFALLCEALTKNGPRRLCLLLARTDGSDAADA